MSNTHSSMQAREASSYLSAGNAEYLEALYEQFLNDPNSVDPHWRSYFQSIKPATTDIIHQQIRPLIASWSAQVNTKESASSADALKQARVWDYIDAYRHFGHLIAKIDPLELTNFPAPSQLTLAFHGLSTQDLDASFDTHQLSKQALTLRDIQTQLNAIYCQHIGFEYAYLSNEEEYEWLRQRIEPMFGQLSFSSDEKKRILNRLVAAEGLEKYLASKYVGQKRFGLEGGESLIPMIDEVIQASSATGANEIVIGMAHRGRLNVLVNVMGWPSHELFSAFEGKHLTNGDRSGDVKYHMGFSSDIEAAGGAMHLALGFNPSHLEIIAPVIEGSVRARQHYWHDTARKQIIPLQIHGDSAFIGQGVVMETFNLAYTRGFNTGGTIHLVINNQVGFTTSDPRDTRSTRYCTDIAKMVDAPIFHVNADDPEAVVAITKLATEFRMKFNRDVVVDLVCYRRHGHNEADEPAATQPLMYKKIKQLPTTLSLYSEKLVAEKVVTQADVDALVLKYRNALDQGLAVVDTLDPSRTPRPRIDWTPYMDQPWTAPCTTAVPLETIKKLGARLETLPDGFTLQAQVKKMMDEREKMTAGLVPINWGYAEAMAFATLLYEGHHVRLCGQDSRRGTFAHRHATLHDFNTGQDYTPLEHLDPKQASFSVIDSVLSEEAVVGFEYGYASTNPYALDIWEAQYGDFANGAQVVIDQFISSADQKWGRLCGLTLQLPHGYEGDGPEHSSARLERYLQLCAQQNMQVCTPTTPAQVFHMLRRQIKRPFRKPLIVMSPKSMLRNKLVVSSLTDLSEGEFQVVIPEIDAIDPKNVTRIVLCCGKVYYDLLEKRRADKLDHIAIIRIEQLYPFPEEALTAQVARYPNAKRVIWCQEEPKNQGAWYCTQHHLWACLTPNQSLEYAGRAASASSAAGYRSLHQEQQAALIHQALIA